MSYRLSKKSAISLPRSASQGNKNWFGPLFLIAQSNERPDKRALDALDCLATLVKEPDYVGHIFGDSGFELQILVACRMFEGQAPGMEGLPLNHVE